MYKIQVIAFFSLLLVLFNSCQAIGDIFQAGVWVGIIVVIIIILILFAIFRRRS